MKTIEVSAAVIVNNNKIFCAQRRNDGPLAMKWEFPGGKLESGESGSVALKRELMEELNLDIDIGDFIMTVHHQYPTFRIIMHSYFINYDSFDIKLTEHLDSKWLTKDELTSVDWAEADIPIVNKVMELIK